MHALPCAHVTHAPSEQTRFAPQGVPLTAFPLTWQVDVPVAQEIVPTLQASWGWQLAPAAHATHAPPLQTLFVPH